GMSQSPREANRTSVSGLFWDKSKQQLVTQLTSNEGWDKPMVLIDGKEVIDDFFAQPTVHITGNTMTAVFDVSNWIGEVDLTDRTVSVTVSDTNFAEEMTAQVGSEPIAYQASNNGFLAMIGFALIGGLILN
ncbi:cytochrome C biogenesis protein, partial [Vibrio lentus]|nr:cytochrome C biogenesis protein [Vibrio lentus]